MTSKNHVEFHRLTRNWLGCALLALLTNGCAASQFDTTDGEVTSSTEGMVYIGDQLHSRGDDDGAVDFYTRALQRVPNDLLAHKHLGEIFEAHGYNAEASEHYRTLVKLAPDVAGYHRLYGRVLIKLNRPADAKAEYLAALKKNSSDMKSLNGLGVALDLLGDHTGAQDNYRKVIDQNSDDLVATNNLGHSYVLSGNNADAIKLLEPIADRSDSPAALRENLAEAYAMSNRDDDAMTILKKDLNEEQARKKIASFHKPHAQTSDAPVFADLGSFTTAELARGRIEHIKEKFAADLSDVTLEIVPGAQDLGGTPEYYARATEFKSPAGAKAFCATLKKSKFFCKLHGVVEAPAPHPTPHHAAAPKANTKAEAPLAAPEPAMSVAPGMSLPVEENTTPAN
jgi:Flp pilus assembly protein TadD